MMELKLLIVLLAVCTASASPTKKPEQKLAVEAKTNCPNAEWEEWYPGEQGSQGKSEVRSTDDVVLFRNPN